MEGNRRHLGLVLLILLYSGHAHSQSVSCQEASSCCTCVATPGCSWYYNSTLPEPFCDYTPHGYSSLTNVDETLETRTPYALVKRVIQPRGKCKPINRSRGRMITPQAVQVKQNVGLRQEIQFEVMAMSRSLRMRVVDGTGGAVGFSVKPSFSNTCPGRFTAVGRNHRRGRRLVVMCSRASPGEVSKFKLVLDQLACYSDPRELRVILLEPNSRKRLRVFVEPNCACPCSSSSSSTTSSYTTTTLSSSPSSSSSSSSSSPSSSSPSSSPSSSSTPQNADVIRNGGGRGGRRRGGGRSESEPSARGRRSESERSAVAAPACVADCGAAWTTPLSDGTCNNDMCHATAPESPCSDNGVCVCGQCACGRPASAEDRRIASIFTNMPGKA
ncbi:uncharacterized serine-rich protein C215.13 [Aplysia californica]|uniref:Uncharacterized serine-rich protein C215.13 n=1 Tax=Aplysia californica TaxID=6500 RepID=A0ABM0JVE3_APLCA|nr:uncharacterized serine-rich protein C215.13 [Aplysia californica]